MDDQYRIRPATSADLEVVAQLERATFTDPWALEAFHGHLHDLFLVAEAASGVVGYLIAWRLDREAEILNLAVAGSQRRRGLGRSLVLAAVGRLAEQGTDRVFLEVRVSNDGARRLYEECGFRELGRRRGYYRRPREDALVLGRELAGPATV